MPTLRVLHLIDGRGTGDAALMACAQVTHGVTDAEHRLCLLGPGELEDRAARLGLPTTDRIAPPLGRPLLAWRGLRRLVRDRGRPDLVHAWSPDAHRLARRALGGSVPCVTVPAPAIAAPRDVDPARRRILREAMGAGPGEPVLLLAGEGEETDAQRFVFLLGLLAQADVRTIGLIPRASARLSRALRFHRRLGRPTPVFIGNMPAACLADLSDVAVWVGPALSQPGAAMSGASAAQLACLQAAGVAVVAPREAMGGAAASLTAACAAHNATPPELSRILIPLLKQESLRLDAGRCGRAWIERARPAAAFVAAVEEAYRRVSGGGGVSPIGSASPALEGVPG